MSYPRKTTFRAACLFGGAGGMALGTQQARQKFRDHAGRFELCGAYDFSAYACAAYEYLTGSPEAQLDARVTTPSMIRELFGEEPPDACWLSGPCKGSSKLLSSALAQTPKYIAMNDLSIIGVRALLEAYPDNPIGLLIFENVPNITTRARKMLVVLRALLREHGYKLHDGYHEARHIGDLAQRRKRWFLIARHPDKVPVLIYRPPHKAGKVCGDVLGKLPLPNDPAGGPMHRLSNTSTINLLRLWAIPAGGDWRDLIADGRPRRERFRRHHIEKWTEPSVTIGGSGSNGPCAVADPRDAAAVELGRQTEAFHHVDRVTGWNEATGTVTAGVSSSNGAPSVADPRVALIPPCTQGKGRWGVFSKHQVTHWADPSKAVIGGEGNGATAVADPRLNLLGGERCWHDGALGVVGLGDVGATVTGATRPTNGRFSLADPRVPRFKGSFGVVGADQPASTVTAEAAPSTGRFAYAALVPPQLRPQAGNGNLHWGKYVVVPWLGVSSTVATASRVGSGAPSVADPRVDLARASAGDGFHEGAGPGRWGVLSPLEPSTTVTRNARVGTGPFSIAAQVPVDLSATGQWRNRYGVLSAEEESATVTGNARLSTGAFSYAAPVPVALVPDKKCYDAGYGVLSHDQPSRTIATKAAVGCGAYAIADKVPVDLVPQGVQDNPERAARYGVLRPDQPSRTITGTTRVGCGAYAIADKVPVDLELGCTPRADAYGVTSFDAEAATVTGHFKVDNSRAAVADPRPAPPPYVVLSHAEVSRIVSGEVQVPFAVVDPAYPDEPLAIVDKLKNPPFRWVETRGRKGKLKRKKETVALVLISADGTWHRPLTTLELAVLQAFPSSVRGKPLDFGGGTTAQREVIGNAVPPAVAEAMASQVLLSLLVASTPMGFTYTPGTAVWVRALERQLRQEGYIVVKGRKAMNFTTGEVLDDGHPIWRWTKPKKHKRQGYVRAKRVPQSQEQHASRLLGPGVQDLVCRVDQREG